MTVVLTKFKTLSNNFDATVSFLLLISQKTAGSLKLFEKNWN
jgi:hypothetical protein